ncbi:polysaccharide deacetylase family protein [Hydrogenimonas sp. SS33]|uniref:polysaccharide deacetylase family protein n=1 Tax=Hydrogenimonas leucolamina TaxID=2954236 RepID=UPI00336BFAAC
MRSLLALWLLAAGLLADAHIFVYHRFGDTRHPSTDTSVQTLRKQFDYFRKHGYEVVPLSKLVAALKDGEPVSDRWVVLTIDDSFESFYEKGLPIFREYGYPFTLFVYTEATDKKYGDYMSWEEVNEAKRFGELGFHSHAHPHMVSKSDTYLKKDFEKGLALMERHTGRRPSYFAYPYGEYDTRVRKIAESFGFDAICNQNVGAVSERSDVMDLDRIALTGDPDLASKLKIRFLDATWLAPRAWPKEGTVGEVKVKLNEPVKARHGYLYLTGYGWERVDIREGAVDTRWHKPLKKRRSRLILKVDRDKINTKILVKP